MTAKKRTDGFTLIELLIVVAIIGILAAIAIPNLLNALQRARQKRTMGDMRTIAIGWESREVDLGHYNAAGIAGADIAVDVDSLEAGITPTYIRAMPKADGWGQPYHCFLNQSWGSAVHADKYAIVSGGSDLTMNPSQPLGPTDHFDCDIVYSGGAFVSYPEGTQQQ